MGVSKFFRLNDDGTNTKGGEGGEKEEEFLTLLIMLFPNFFLSLSKETEFFLRDSLTHIIDRDDM